MDTPRQPRPEWIEQVARDYENRGYRVARQPNLADLLPGAPNNFQVDLVATRGGEEVVVEVKSRVDLATEAQFEDLRRLISATPGWRLDLVIMPSAEDEVREGAKPFDSDHVDATLTEADSLSGAGHAGAAFLLGWSAVEGLLRLIAERNGLVDRTFTPPNRLIDLLASEGILELEERDELARYMRLRNGLAHGFVPGRLDIGDVRRLTDLARRLSRREAIQPAESM